MDPIVKSSSAALPAGVSDDGKVRAQAEAAAQKFEAFFITEALRQMRRTTREMAGEDSIFRDRINDDMLDMADGQVADALAGQRAFGIADAILRQVLPPVVAAADLPVAPVADLSRAAKRSP